MGCSPTKISKFFGGWNAHLQTDKAGCDGCFRNVLKHRWLWSLEKEVSLNLGCYSLDKWEYEERRGNGILDPAQMTTLSMEWWVAQLGAMLLLWSGDWWDLYWLSSGYEGGWTARRSVHPRGNQPQIFIGRTDTKAEAPILWPPDVKSWFTGKDPDAGKDWRQEEKGATEDEIVI